MTPIEQLAEQVGLHPSYIDSFGKQVDCNPQARTALLQAMGFDLSSDEAILTAAHELRVKPWRDMLPPSQIIPAEHEHYYAHVAVAAEHHSAKLDWVITTETGKTLKGVQSVSECQQIDQADFDGVHYVKVQLPLPKLEQGYHSLKVSIKGAGKATGHIIVAPKTCYSPQEASPNKAWGIAAQLYSLKSDNSWGIGDFGDLQELIRSSAKKGVSAIGLNPLHPLFPNNPAHCSPYSPSSRTFLNTIYIDVTQTSNYKGCEAAQKVVNSKTFKENVERANSQEMIDYPAASWLKNQVLELLYEDFAKSTRTKAYKAYKAFCEEQGRELDILATFDALYEHFRKIDENAYGWTAWPKDFQDYNSPAVATFQKENSHRIGYFKYLQWLADEQLAASAQLAADSGMPVGLYLDLAVGCDGGGAEVWADKENYIAGAAVGAPPDLTNVLGQDWGLTPINPVVLQEKGYAPLAKALRSSMHYAGALRIDHILGLMRQYWVAPGMGAHEGVYISFPLEDILRIIALESRRSECVVIGEDLGTVPDGFGEIMAAAGLLSYKVLYFERWESGLFMRPDMYPEQSIVTVSTHDMPTLGGWWTGRDLQWRQDLNLYPNEEMGQQDREQRIADRQMLIDAMTFEGTLKPEDAPPQAPAQMNEALAIAVQQFLAKADSHIQFIPVEDLLVLEEQVNIPGTTDEHPNWRRRLPVEVKNLWAGHSAEHMVKAMQEARPK